MEDPDLFAPTKEGNTRPFSVAAQQALNFCEQLKYELGKARVTLPKDLAGVIEVLEDGLSFPDKPNHTHDHCVYAAETLRTFLAKLETSEKIL